jgi:hypothetical protein
MPFLLQKSPNRAEVRSLFIKEVRIQIVFTSGKCFAVKIIPYIGWYPGNLLIIFKVFDELIFDKLSDSQDKKENDKNLKQKV